jgi:hypothetical protein
MGLLGGLKSTYAKAEAAVVVQNLLQHQFDIGNLSLDPAKLANNLVAAVWNAKTDILSGKFGQRPHKIAVAAIALGNGISSFDDNDGTRNVLIISLGNILSEVEVNGRLYPFNSLDGQLFEDAASCFAEALEKLSDSPLGQIIADNVI